MEIGTVVFQSTDSTLLAHDGGETEHDRFHKEYKPCLYSQFCLLVTGSSAGSPYAGIGKRDQEEIKITKLSFRNE
eukprot:11487465-Ditylum_brightwellii.AAC.1